MTNLQNATADFVCKCGQQWFLMFPMPMVAEAYTALLRAVRCPTCGDRRSIRMSEVEVLPDEDPNTVTIGSGTVELRALWCIHCGQTFSTTEHGEYQKIVELFKEHDLNCEKHPLVKRVKELEAQLEARP